MKGLFLSMVITVFVFKILTGQELPRFHVTALSLITVDEEEKIKMLGALKVFEVIMDNKEFQQKLLDTVFYFDLQEDPMRSLTSKQIVDTLYSGKEWYRTKVDNTAEIEWECTKRKHKPPFSKAIGYGLESDSIIHTYRFFVRNNGVAAITGNLAHEWTHKMGFDHEKDDHIRREYTVPYLFGNLIEKFAERMGH